MQITCCSARFSAIARANAITSKRPKKSSRCFPACAIGERSWPEHFLYFVAVGDARGGADTLVLDNIVNHASAEIALVLKTKYDPNRVDHLRHAEKLAQFAQSIESTATSVAKSWQHTLTRRCRGKNRAAAIGVAKLVTSNQTAALKQVEITAVEEKGIAAVAATEVWCWP